MDLERNLNIARAAARLAAQNLKRLWDVPRSVTIKGDESLLTQIDAENERILSEYLASETPDFGFLGEETGIHAARTSDAPYWYVDPVDGTSNMVHRFHAAEGMGAFLNDSPIHVSKNTAFERALLATGFPVGPHPSGVFPNLKNFGAVSVRTHSVRRPGSAALDLCAVACGWFDGFWEINLKPWDTAGGTIIVREAGGIVTGFDGDAYDPHVPYIIATNGVFHQTLSDIVKKDG